MQFKTGDIVDGKVVSVKDFGAFVELPDKSTGMVHISEVANNYVSNINDFVKVGDFVKVKVLGETDQGKISLSIKKALPPVSVKKKDSFKGGSSSSGSSFEDLLRSFKATSDEKISGLKQKNPESRRPRRGTK